MYGLVLCLYTAITFILHAQCDISVSKMIVNRFVADHKTKGFPILFCYICFLTHHANTHWITFLPSTDTGIFIIFPLTLTLLVILLRVIFLVACWHVLSSKICELGLKYSETWGKAMETTTNNTVKCLIVITFTTAAS